MHTNSGARDLAWVHTRVLQGSPVTLRGRVSPVTLRGRVIPQWKGLGKGLQKSPESAKAPFPFSVIMNGLSRGGQKLPEIVDTQAGLGNATQSSHGALLCL